MDRQASGAGLFTHRAFIAAEEIRRVASALCDGFRNSQHSSRFTRLDRESEARSQTPHDPMAARLCENLQQVLLSRMERMAVERKVAGLNAQKNPRQT